MVTMAARSPLAHIIGLLTGIGAALSAFYPGPDYSGTTLAGRVRGDRSFDGDGGGLA